MRRAPSARRFVLLRRSCGCALLVGALAVTGGFLVLSEELHDSGMWGEWRRSTNRTVPRVTVLTYGCGVLFAGTETAGVYRLDERAERWEPFSRGLADPEVNDLFVEPSSCSLFAATEQGVLASSAEGGGWEPLSDLGPREATPLEIAVVKEPRGHSDVLVALAEQGTELFRSLDGGNSWAAIPLPDDPLFRDLSPSPVEPGEILLLGRSQVWRSSDTGLSWQAVERFNAAGEALSALIRSSEGTPGTVAICTFEGECFWSGDSGSSWHETKSTANTLDPLAILGGPRGVLIAVSQHKRSERPQVFSYSSRIHRLNLTAHPGQRWQEPAILEGLVDALETHPDEDRRVFAGSTAGVHESRDGGRSWRLLNRGLEDTVAARDLARSGDRLFVLTDHGKTIYSDDGGRTWHQLGPTHRTGPRSLVIDPSTPCKMLRADVLGLHRSLDCGSSWHLLGEQRFPALESAEQGPTVYAIGAQHRDVLRSPDFGDHWETILRGRVTELAVVPRDGDHLFVAGIELGSPGRDGLAETRDGGRSWQFLEPPADVRPPWVSLWPTEGGEVFLGVQGTLWQLDPDGSGWHERLALSQDIQSVVQDSDRKNVLYLCARNGVHGSEDGGQTWVDLGAPQDDCRELALVEEGSTLVMLAAGQAYTMERERPARLILRALARAVLEPFTREGSRRAP